MSVYPNRVWEAQAVTGSNTYTSLVTVIPRNQADGKLTYTVDFTDGGSLAGTLTVELSAAHEDELLGDPNAAIAYQTYTKIPSSAVGGSALVFSITITQLAGGTRVRLKYVNSAGSGSIMARVKAR